jgi:hypothetical protein
MHGSTELFPIRPLAPPRRLILGTALALALVIWLAPGTPDAAAQDSPPATGKPAATITATSPAGDGSGVGANSAAKAAPEAATNDQVQERADVAVKAEKDPATGQHTITVTKNGKTVTVTGTDKEFDSFDEFAHKEPGIAFAIVAIVAVAFLSPVLAIALILAYRMRKARMQNETMLKLAERGLVAPAEAMAAVATGTLPPQVASETGAGVTAGIATPLDHARALRKHAAWSDLRKGVVMGAIGLGLTLYSLFEERSANGIGLVLLFVGIGYVVLWWFEERRIAPHGGGMPPGSGPGSPL